MATVTLEDRGGVVAKRLKGRIFGSTKVLDAVAWSGRDIDDDLATWLDITLSDPLGDTWPLEDMVDLRRAVADLAVDVDLDTVLYVRVKPKSDDVQADELQPGETPLFET